MIYLDIKNNSSVKHLCNRNALVELTRKICLAEGQNSDVELSLLLCDDAFIQKLNARYRKRNEPTDVLAFEQEAPLHTDRCLLGDIIISLETVQRFCGNDRNAMRQELLLLFCHGLLHLFGYDHHKAADKRRMQEKQAHYLGIGLENVWH